MIVSTNLQHNQLDRDSLEYCRGICTGQWFLPHIPQRYCHAFPATKSTHSYGKRQPTSRPHERMNQNTSTGPDGLKICLESLTLRLPSWADFSGIIDYSRPKAAY